MQKNDKIIDHIIKLTFCLFYANAIVIAILSATIISINISSLIFCTSLATIVFYIIYSMKRVFKVAWIAALILLGIGIIGYIIASLTNNAPSINDLYYNLIDLLSGYKRLSINQQLSIVYGVSVAMSIITVTLISRKIIFSALSALAAASFFGQLLTGNLMSQQVFIVLIFVVLFIGIYKSFLNFENRSGGLGFDLKRLVSVPIFIFVSILVIIASTVAPLEGAYVKYLSIENLSRNAFVKNGEGSYYLSWSGVGGDDDVLGGAIQPDYTSVLKLESDEPLYIAGNYKNKYNGRGWSVTDLQKEKYTGGTDINTQVKLDAFKKANLKYKINNVKLQVADMKFRTLFQANGLVDMPKPKGRTVWIDLNKNMYTNDYMRKGFKYQFSSYTFKNEDIAKLARESFIGKQSQDPTITDVALKNELALIYKDYTALPDTLPKRVGDLAKEITKDKKTNYDKVVALQEYMYRFSYTLNAPITPKDRDFVDYFLFDLKKGYCTYYASALSVMARTLGLPTRYVEGFSQQPAADGKKITIDNSMAHSWTDVYFEGLGWVTFEATPPNAEWVYDIKMEDYKLKVESKNPIDNTPSQNQTSSAAASASTASGLTSSGATSSNKPVTNNLGDTVIVGNPSGGGGFQITVQDMINFLIIILVVIAVIMIPVTIVKNRKKQMLRLQTYDNRTFVIACWRELLRLMKFDKKTLEAGETIHQFMLRLSEIYDVDTVFTASDTFNKAVYSEESLNDNERVLAAQAYASLDECIQRRKNKWWFKINRYLLHRI